jgi:hypothetical protein
MLRLFSPGAAALVVSLGWGGGIRAADVAPPPPPPVAAAPAASCPTCAAAPTADCATPGCKTCGKGHFNLLHRPCKPYATHLCPGACFGYFQTQWHRWENVCPIPYQGVDMTDAPPRPIPGAATTLPAPRPNPMPMGTSDAPPPRPAPMPTTPPGNIPLPKP